MATAAKNPALKRSNSEKERTIHRGTVRDAEVIADRMHPRSAAVRNPCAQRVTTQCRALFCERVAERRALCGTSTPPCWPVQEQHGAEGAASLLRFPACRGFCRARTLCVPAWVVHTALHLLPMNQPLTKSHEPHIAQLLAVVAINSAASRCYHGKSGFDTLGPLRALARAVPESVCVPSALCTSPVDVALSARIESVAV